MKNYEKLDRLLVNRKFYTKPDMVLLKLNPTNHILSKEEQMYFIKVTEGVFGYSEQIRNEYLKLISTDYHIALIEPFICIFIKETIHRNIVKGDLTMLIYAVRMTKSLLANDNLLLKPYLHEILPAVLSCVLAKKISKFYNNHWTLRDFSAYIIALICHKFNNNLNNIQERVINVYKKGIEDPNKVLTTTYGAIKGLGSLGDDIIKDHLIPNIKLISLKIQKMLEINYNSFYVDYRKQQMNEAKHIRDILVTICSPILLQTHNVNDGGILYMNEFGYLGKELYIQVKNIESIEQTKIKKELIDDLTSTSISSINTSENLCYFKNLGLVKLFKQM